MKNVHLIPTDKPSRLMLRHGELLFFKDDDSIPKGTPKNQNIYITNNEVKKNGEWVLSNLNEVVKFCSLYCQNSYKKIILTTDDQLIKDGVQAIDDEFLEFIVKNPSCEEVEIADLWKEGTPSAHDSYQMIIPKEEPKQELERGYTTSETKLVGMQITLKDGSQKFISKQETLEEAKFRIYKDHWNVEHTQWIKSNFLNGFEAGAKWQQEQDKNKYSEEEVIQKILDFRFISDTNTTREEIKEWFNKVKNK